MQKNKNNNVDDFHLKILYEFRGFLAKEKIKNEDSFDKHLLSIATGSLYLSVFFTSQIEKNITNTRLLATGWGLLIVSILLILISFLFSINAFKLEIENVDRQIENSCIDDSRCNFFNKVVHFLQWTSLVFFVLGSTLFVAFYFINIT